ncbi:hypothetical protein BJY01DRAFT_258755 [Aspergillus pseudoustus]|uniref:Rhodopsin domain-containing protein n=1 Tax=Aspergillus pseudoustus TaxID=1810923 RepID=A0ABR4J815_9EURO
MAYITASNGSLQPMFLIIMSLLLFLSSVTVSLRLYCRLFRVHKVGLDDYLIVAALAVTIGMGIMNGFHIAMGSGRHLSDLAPVLGKILVPTLKHWYAYQLVYPITVGLVKFSILSQYYRIFEVVNFRKQVIAVGIFVAVYTIVCIFVNAFECHSKPWRAWDPEFPKGCNSLPATYFSTAAISIFTDLVILVMPLPQLMKLNLHRRRKYALIAIFLTGTFASAASIARLNALYKYTVTEDVSYDALQILLWSQIEVNVAIISASAPSLRPLFHRIFKGSSYGRQRPSNSPYAGYGTYGNGESNFRRTLTGAGTHHGAIELTSRDDEAYARNRPNVSRSASTARNGTVDDENSSQELILDQNANIMKTVVIEMKSEHRA